MVFPDLHEFLRLSEDYDMVPVKMEIQADMETPISIYKRFQDEKYGFLLESVEGGVKWGRYSFIGRNPFMVVRVYGNTLEFEDREGGICRRTGNPIRILDETMSHYRSPVLAGFPRFTGGAAGFLGYDMVRHIEHLPSAPNDDLGLPDAHLMFTDEVIAFDHLAQKMEIIVNAGTSGNPERNYRGAVDRLNAICEELRLTRWKLHGRSGNDVPGRICDPGFDCDVSMQEYCDGVIKAKEYIRNGDIFQVVLSRRFRSKVDCSSFDLYRALRTINPSPYMFCMNYADYSLAGASPEMLVRVEDGTVETCPIAGTRKRGSSTAEDERLCRELQNDEKELAEHMMLVDLGRNDIGKVSEFGSVRVMDMKHIEKFSHVMHMVTNVKGKLRKGLTAFDALSSVLPAGTLSGAPKIRAMEIIDQLEKSKRGPYGGAAGYICFNGNMDSCITIRTFVFKDGNAYIQAGAGIVADSDPEREYEESGSKAMALLEAVKKAGEFL